MATIQNLSQLLQHSQCQYQVFDLGRRIQQIDNDDFLHVEMEKKPYPYPLQRHAHLAISYWNEHKQPWIWFLKFPLDERGLLNQTDTGNFLKYINDAMGAHLQLLQNQQELTEDQREHLANNPYTFKPTDDKMAVFHSIVRANLTLDVSPYYAPAQDFFAGKMGWDNWQTIGLQGIADIGARLADKNGTKETNSQMIRLALPKLAAEPKRYPALYALLGVLEHSTINDKLAQQLADLSLESLRLENNQTVDLFLLSAFIRALSGANVSILNTVVDAVLAREELCHKEILVAIAGRCWSSLNAEDRAVQFLLRLAQTGDQSLFNQLFADLVMLPELRMTLLPLLHNAPSPELTQALVMLRQQTHEQPIH